MITFSKLGKKGNLGNQLFQIASTVGIARKHGHSWCFPKWKYSEYLNLKLPACDKNLNFQKLNERSYHVHDWPVENGDYDLEGWLQSEKYFDIAYTRKIFSFNPVIKEKTLGLVKTLFDKKTILISIRRGDFVNHPLYFQLSYKYYFLALLEFFPDWHSHNILFTSDDINWCKEHFQKLKNAHFLEGFKPMEQIIISSQCDHFIISNSTFSWWQAWLGEKNDSKIIRPIKNHRNTKHFQPNDNDYFPERWIEFDHRNKIIPVKFYNFFLQGERSRLESFMNNKLNGLKYRLKKHLPFLA